MKHQHEVGAEAAEAKPEAEERAMDTPDTFFFLADLDFGNNNFRTTPPKLCPVWRNG